jgi:hypothetical protein
MRFIIANDSDAPQVFTASRAISHRFGDTALMETLEHRPDLIANRSTQDAVTARDRDLQCIWP